MNTLTQKEMKYGIRHSKMLLHEVYFWTDTIKDWKNLLTDDAHKEIIINCWQELVRRGKMKVYGFVIMPNHIHVLWEMLDKNGKEMPYASFNKYTSHQFLERLRLQVFSGLYSFKEHKPPERVHRFWQRDALAVMMDSQWKFEQKLEYIHNNPLQERWSLVDRPENYKWSSARFYETGEDDFDILTHYGDRF